MFASGVYLSGWTCRLLQHESCREEVLYGNRVVVTYLMDALDHHHSGVRKAADEVLELILELDRRPQESTSLASAIKKKRFEAFNAQWLSFMTAAGKKEGVGVYEEVCALWLCVVDVYEEVDAKYYSADGAYNSNMNPHAHAALTGYPPGSGAAGYEERLSDNEYPRGGNGARGRGYSAPSNDNGYDHQV